MDEIKEQLKDMHGSIDEISAVQMEQHYILIEHQRRSAANEARLFVVESFYEDFKDHMAQLAGAIKLFKVIVATGSVALLVTELYNYFN